MSAHERRDLDAIADSMKRIEKFYERAAATPRATTAAPAFIAGQYVRRDGNSYAKPAAKTREG